LRRLLPCRDVAGIKSSDAVIVGIYDRYTDQPAENAALVRRYGTNVSG